LAKPRARLSTAASKSQSAVSAGFFRPVNETSRTPTAAFFMIAVPVAVSPVKVIASTAEFWVMNSPAELGPKPCTTL
jgi:hypothetical protein